MRRLHLTGLVLLALVGCSTQTTQATGGDPIESDRSAPPTIGLGSEIADASDVGARRAVDAEAVESIIMVGDSITVGVTPALDAQFEALGFDDATIVAQISKRMAESSGDNLSGAEIVQFITENEERVGPEQLWVIALGTNDIGKYSAEETVGVINALLAPIPAESPVVWIDTYLPANAQGAADVNAAIVQAMAARGNATVGRWSEIAGVDGVLSSDGVHPSSDGSLVFASLVTSTVAAFLEPE